MGSRARFFRIFLGPQHHLALAKWQRGGCRVMKEVILSLKLLTMALEPPPTFSLPTSLLCSTLTKLSLSSRCLCPGCAPVRDALFQIPALFSNSHLPVPPEGSSCFSGPRQPWLSSWSSLVPMCYLLKGGDEAEALGAPVSPSTGWAQK